MIDNDLLEKIANEETARAKRKDELGSEEPSPFYEKVPKGKMKPDARAIEAFDKMVRDRPLSPPGRAQ